MLVLNELRLDLRASAVRVEEGLAVVSRMLHRDSGDPQVQSELRSYLQSILSLDLVHLQSVVTRVEFEVREQLQQLDESRPSKSGEPPTSPHDA